MVLRAVIFDFFRTLVMLDPLAPTMKVKDPSWRKAMEVLRAPAAELLPKVRFDALLDALAETTLEIATARAPEYLEVPIAERYARALAKLLVTDTRIAGE